MGPGYFFFMINDLCPDDACSWKYVDDTSLAEIVPRDSHSEIKMAAAVVDQWSSNNKLQLNADKSKDRHIDFKLAKHHFDGKG